MNEIEPPARNQSGNPYGGMQGTPESSGGLSVFLRNNLIPIRKFWWVVIPCIVASVFWESSKIDKEPRRYSSIAVMMVSPQIALPQSGMYREEFANFFGTQIQLMRSDLVQDNARKFLAAKKPEWRENPPQIISFYTEQRTQTSMFELRALGSDPEYTREYLDAVMDAYRATKKSMKKDASDVTYSTLQAEIAYKEKEIQRYEDEIQKFQSENNVIFIREQASQSAGYLLGLHRQVVDLRTELNLIQLFEEAKTKGTRTNGIGPENEVNKDPQFLTLQQKAKNLKAELLRFSKVLRPEHPKIKQIQADIEQLSVLMGVYSEQGETEISKRKNDILLRLKNIEATIDDAEVKSVNLSKKLSEYERIHSRLERARTLYNQIVDALDNIKLDLRIDQEWVNVLEPAKPATPTIPDRNNRLVTAGTKGLALGIGILVFIIMLNDRIYTFFHFPSAFGLRLAAHIPRVRAKKGGLSLLQKDDSRYSFIESFRNLRSFILLHSAEAASAHQGGNPEAQNGNGNRSASAHVIAITSAIPSEGKSTISANLAITLAMSGKRTLLVDADMRRGTQHQTFKIKETPGLAQVLRGEKKWDECVVKTDYDNLFLLPRGTAVMESSELILSANSEEFFNKIKNSYDFILLDTPPVLAADDMANLIKYIQQVILVARLNLSSKRSVSGAIEQLQSRKAPILGYVLNSCEGDSAGYYGYYYKYQYYGYKEKSMRS